jgi:hypothetical protein
MLASELVRTVACPQCGACPDQPCVRSGGQRRERHHAARVTAFRERDQPNLETPIQERSLLRDKQQQLKRETAARLKHDENEPTGRWERLSDLPAWWLVDQRGRRISWVHAETEEQARRIFHAACSPAELRRAHRGAAVSATGRTRRAGARRNHPSPAASRCRSTTTRSRQTCGTVRWANRWCD